MKQGAKIGKVDCAYNEIKVGDTVRNKHTGAEYVVTSYGSLNNGNGVLSKWDPDDWRVVRAWDEALREAHDAETAAVQDSCSVQASETADDGQQAPAQLGNIDGLEDAREEAEYCGPKERGLSVESVAVEASATDAARIDTPFSDIVKAKELVSELRMMGYTVTCSKSVFVEL